MFYDPSVQIWSHQFTSMAETLAWCRQLYKALRRWTISENQRCSLFSHPCTSVSLKNMNMWPSLLLCIYRENITCKLLCQHLSFSVMVDIENITICFSEGKKILKKNPQKLHISNWCKDLEHSGLSYLYLQCQLNINQFLLFEFSLEHSKKLIKSTIKYSKGGVYLLLFIR